MLEKIKKHQNKLKIFQDVRALGLMVFGILMILLTWSGVKVAQTNYELAKKMSVERQKVQIAQLQNQNLKLKNQYYESDQFLELASRRQFGKALPGEKLYIVTDEVALKYTKEQPSEATEAKKSEKPKPRFITNINKWVEFLNK